MCKRRKPVSEEECEGSSTPGPDGRGLTEPLGGWTAGELLPERRRKPKERGAPSPESPSGPERA